MFQEKLPLILQQECAIDMRLPLLVGVSGGPDSLALMVALHNMGCDLIVAHVNHQLRADAPDDATVAENLAKARGLRFELLEVDVRQFAKKHKLSIEEAARIVRYEFLFEQAQKYQAQAVAVAHTADDQVETVLMHLLRGSGMAGLRGMPYRALPNPWSDRLPLIRPLLGVWRQEVLAYCAERELSPRFDSTNSDTTYFRNRIRQELIPSLETYNPEVRRAIFRMADTLAADYDALEKWVEIAWESCISGQGPGYIIFSLKSFANYPLALQRMLIRRMAAVLRPDIRDVGFDVVERALDWLQEPPHAKECGLISGLRLFREDDAVYMTMGDAQLPMDAWPQLESPQEELFVPDEVQLSDGWWLSLTFQEDPVPDEVAQNDDPFQAWIALSSSIARVSLRTRKPGDRFQPLGMGGGSIKLTDYFTNRKLPLRARDGWPLICVDDQIAWVAGYHVAHPFRVTEETQLAIHLQLIKA